MKVYARLNPKGRGFSVEFLARSPATGPESWIFVQVPYFEAVEHTKESLSYGTSTKIGEHYFIMGSCGLFEPGVDLYHCCHPREPETVINTMNLGMTFEQDNTTKCSFCGYEIPPAIVLQFKFMKASRP